MKRNVRFLLIAAGALALGGLSSSCSHYTLGTQKPAALKDINTLNVAVFENNTFYPRAEVLLTSSVAEEVSSNGTFRLASQGKCDATIRGAVTSVTLDQARSQTYNTYKSAQGMMTVTVSYEVVSGDNGRVLSKGIVKEASNFFTSGNEQSAKWDAYSYAARVAAQRIVANLVN